MADQSLLLIADIGGYTTFHSQLQRMIVLNMCSCDACMQSRNLKIEQDLEGLGLTSGRVGFGAGAGSSPN